MRTALACAPAAARATLLRCAAMGSGPMAGAVVFRQVSSELARLAQGECMGACRVVILVIVVIVALLVKLSARRELDGACLAHAPCPGARLGRGVMVLQRVVALAAFGELDQRRGRGGAGCQLVLAFIGSRLPATAARAGPPFNADAVDIDFPSGLERKQRRRRR